MTCNKEFCSSYLVLKPEHASLSDLFGILFSRDIEKIKFIDSSERTEDNFRARWLIFISVLLQVVLQFVAKPLSLFGSLIELWLNLLSCNHNFDMLLLNFVRGTVVIPDKASPTFLSIVGKLNSQVELDKTIKHGDNKYYGALCVMAAKTSYECKARIETTVQDYWKMEFLGSYDFWNDYEEKYTTRAQMFRVNADPDVIIVAFRGTQLFSADDLCRNLDISWYELPGVGRIHGSFMKALGLQKNQGWPREIKDNDNRPALAYYFIREKIRKLMQVNEGTKFIVTGHGLGGALAILFLAVLALHEETWMLGRCEAIYTYGQPRVGDMMFGEFMQEQLNKYGVKYCRFVYNNDIVTRLPYDDPAPIFTHFGMCCFFNRFYEGKILPEEPDNNYFSLLALISKKKGAISNLVRGFGVPYKEGQDYKETRLLRIVRVIGLLFPGLGDHCIQDYINVTRLGSLDSNYRT